jgi:hypothetical protein
MFTAHIFWHNRRFIIDFWSGEAPASFMPKTKWNLSHPVLDQFVIICNLKIYEQLVFDKANSHILVPYIGT